MERWQRQAIGVHIGRASKKIRKQSGRTIEEPDGRVASGKGQN